MLNQHELTLDYILQDDYEIDETKEYTLENLRVGMRVHTGQISHIYNKRILLANPINIDLPDGNQAICGVVVFIGKTGISEESYEASKEYTVNNTSPCVIENFEAENFSDNISYPEGWRGRE